MSGQDRNAERIEVMLADPGGVHAELVGKERFGGDLGDELVRGAGVVVVVIVAQREIAEVHDALPVAVNCDPLRPCGSRIVENASVVNTLIWA